MDPRDHASGMERPIARRDFLNGVAIGAGGILASGWLPAQAQAQTRPPGAQDLPGYYPPALTGMRGSHPGSYEAAHAVRDGTPSAPTLSATSEIYDLVIVGAGIGGLAAAHFYLAHKPEARILILDNHDDFGGHAKRDEFRVDGRLLLANGGTWAIESPFPYSSVARGLLAELGIDPPRLERRDHHAEYYRGLARAVFFDRETFGVDRLVTGLPQSTGDRPSGAASAAVWSEFLAQTPLSAQAQSDIVKIETGSIDYLPGMTSDAKKERLSRVSYRDFLLDIVKALGTRSASRRPGGAAPNAVRHVRAQHSRSARARARTRRIRSARDIAAITVNRWPHGYAYEYNPLWDPDGFFDGGTTPNQIARRPFGIAIANTDVAAAAYIPTRPSIKLIAPCANSRRAKVHCMPISPRLHPQLVLITYRQMIPKLACNAGIRSVRYLIRRRKAPPVLGCCRKHSAITSAQTALIRATSQRTEHSDRAAFTHRATHPLSGPSMLVVLTQNAVARMWSRARL